jgi:hypothetical protein
MRWRYPQGTCSSIYPYHSGAQLSVSGDTSGDTLFRNPVQRFAAACRSELAPTITKERASASGCATVQAGAMCKKRTQNPPRATSWGFDPPSRHHLFSSLNHSLRVAWGHSNCTAEERLSSFRYKNGYTAYGGHLEWFRGIIVILWRPGRFVPFLLFTLNYGMRGG